MTRRVKIGPRVAMPVAGSYSSTALTRKQSGSSSIGCRFGRRDRSTTSPSSSGSDRLTSILLIGPLLRTKRLVCCLQPLLRGFPRAVGLLSAQHLARRVADRDQSADDGCMAGEDPGRPSARL